MLKEYCSEDFLHFFPVHDFIQLKVIKREETGHIITVYLIKPTVSVNNEHLICHFCRKNPGRFIIDHKNSHDFHQLEIFCEKDASPSFVSFLSRLDTTPKDLLFEAQA